MHRPSAALLLAAALFLPTGCCTLAHMACPCPVPKCPPGKLTRETPEDAVDFLIDAFRNRRIFDIYDSFHPEFIRENGAFLREDFSLAYEHFEQDFLADAESLAAADRGWMEPVQTEIGWIAGVKLQNFQTGAEIVFALQNNPKIRIVTNDRFLPGTIEGPIDKDAMVSMNDGRLGLPADFDLTSIRNVSRDAVRPLKPSNIVRVEIADDWQVRLVPPNRAKQIRFMDKIKEHVGK